MEAIAIDLSQRYAFDRVDTPLFERVELFARGLGESSDAVEKEMFRVSGAAGSEEAGFEWALRPEPTAGIMRMFVEHGMHVRPGPLRLWMLGPMFRYDRPQAGRYREFTQWDVEVIGDAGPMVDAELIELAHRFYAEAGVTGVVTHLNSIGDAECRPHYRAALIEYFGAHIDSLTDDSRRRLQVNPLRVLDDKQLDPVLAASAPKAIDHLCQACAEHFASVRALLDGLGVPYVTDHHIVRGLDYYTRTAFELYVAGREGQQQSLVGGGRYDGLAELLGGRPTPGIGFGLGIDRAVLVATEQGIAPAPPEPTVGVVSADPDALADRLRVAGELRGAGLRVRVDGSSRKLGKQLESMARHGVRWAVIVGEELTRGSVGVKDLETGEQHEVALNAVVSEVGRS
jgi:histidyl-tRNA synthetase